MARVNAQVLARAAWALAERQHWVITRAQLLGLGFTDEAIEHRIAKGRLHIVRPGVYAVGRAALSREGCFMAAVLNCGHDAALSHVSAGVHWKILSKRGGPIHVSVPTGRSVRRRGIKVYRRAGPFNVTRHHGIPITAAIDTLVDLATALGDDRLERGMNEAVNRGLTNPDALRTAVGAMPRRRGAHRIAMLLDRDTYVVTDTRLEQRLLRIVRGAGLPLPITQRQLGGGRVDFFWPRLGLIVEADSLRYHRTPAQQRADRLRDQKHAAAGLTTLRFTHWQIFFEPEHVRATLTAVIERLAA